MTSTLKSNSKVHPRQADCDKAFKHFRCDGATGLSCPLRKELGHCIDSERYIAVEKAEQGPRGAGQVYHRGRMYYCKDTPDNICAWGKCYIRVLGECDLPIGHLETKRNYPKKLLSSFRESGVKL